MKMNFYNWCNWTLPEWFSSQWRDIKKFYRRNMRYYIYRITGKVLK